MNEIVTTQLLSGLEPLEHLIRHWNVRDSELDYIAEFGLTSDHVPDLIALAREWCQDFQDWPDDHRPVHAWMALGQLRAVGAVRPLLEMLDSLVELDDEWHHEVFPRVFGQIGPPAIEPLAGYLQDESHHEYSQSNVASGLCEIAARFPDKRERIIGNLSNLLGRHLPDRGFLYGELVSRLLDLKAVEAAEVIERAFAANVIDPTIAGDWGDVRSKLGVPGLGIAPDRTPGWPTLRERFGFPQVSFASEEMDPATKRQVSAERKREQKARQQAKAKRRQSRKSRKRNR